MPFKRYTYDEIFHHYGSDRPDTRFSLKIKDLTSLFESVELTFLQSIIKEGGKIGALCVKDKKFSRSELDGWVGKVTKEYGGGGLIYVRFNDDKSHSSPISKFLPEDFFDQAQKYIHDLQVCDTLFIIADQYKTAWSLLGKLRQELAESLELIDVGRHEMFWVTNFPMFEWDEQAKRWFATHHPFTAPEGDWQGQDIKDMRSRAYDLVCNGYELGGGSMRIHDAQVQQKVFDILGISPEEAREKFGFLLEAQQFGYPPEGGIAFGLDRMVMVLGGTDSIREVIAFPKTQRGNDLMMKTPSEVGSEQLKELGIKIVKE